MSASAASTEQETVSPYYKPPQRRTAQLNARVTPDIKAGIADLMKAWDMKNKRRYGKKTPAMSEADAINDLLMTAIEGAWAEFGFHPTTEDQWAELERIINDTTTQLSQTDD